RAGSRLLEEPGDDRVELSAASARQGGVGHLSDQRVLEGELLLSLDPRRGLVSDQVARLERVERILQDDIVLAHPLERTTPEHLSDDRGIEQDVSLLRRKRV